MAVEFLERDGEPFPVGRSGLEGAKDGFDIFEGRTGQTPVQALFLPPSASASSVSRAVYSRSSAR